MFSFPPGDLLNEEKYETSSSNDPVHKHPVHNHPVHKHPGYQTNIIIDPYAKVISVGIHREIQQKQNSL